MRYSIGFSCQKEVSKAVQELSEQFEKTKATFMLYFCDSERFNDITTEIAKAFPSLPTLGSSTYVVFTSKGSGKKALGALILYEDSEVVTGVLPDISIFPLQYIQDVMDSAKKLTKDYKTVCFEITSAFQNGEERTLDTLHKALGDEIEIFGGTSGNSESNKITYQSLNGKVYTQACVYALLNFPIESYINREYIFKPTKSSFTVTNANPNNRTIYELDNLPAIETLSNSLNIKQTELKQYLESHPLGHIIKDNQYIIEPVDFNKDGSISFFAQVFKHSKVAFFEEKKPEEVFTQTTKKVLSVIPNPSFTLAINCMARSKRFESLNKWEPFLASLKAYGKDFIGFSGFGEQYHTHHFNQTLVTSTFGNYKKIGTPQEPSELIDTMTGLNNEKGFLINCQTLLQNAKDTNYIICIFNINNFRVINDVYGFDTGDEIIKDVANYLNMKIKNIGTCAHLHTNTFAFCIPYTIDTMGYLAQLKYIECKILDIPYQLTARAGICNINDVCEGLPDLSDIRLAIDYAIVAQSKVTMTSVNSFFFYNPAMHENMRMEAEITAKMRDALTKKEFHLYFQPQYNHATGALTGAEALCRWIKDDGSIISPGIFIPIFEKNGFIQELDAYVWEETFRIYASWQKKGLNPVPVSTNVSRNSLRNPGIAQHFLRLSKKYKVDPQYVHIEFTESSYMDNQEQIIATSKELRREGFEIAMDDFGSGYSSLNTLKDLPIDILKFDLGFVKGSTSDKGGTILASLMRMAQNLNLVTIAEGVEDKQVADYLRSIGCDIIQGFLYSRPIPQKDYEKLLLTARKQKIKKTSKKQDINIQGFFSPDSVESKIFNNYVGPSAIFEWFNDQFEILRINERYLSEINLDKLIWKEVQKDFLKSLTPESKEDYIEAIEKTVKTHKVAVCISERKIKGKTDSIWIKSQLLCISSVGNRHTIFAIIDNVSNVKNEERRSADLANRMQTIIESSPNGMCLFSAKLKTIGYEIKPIYINQEFSRISGFDHDKLFSFTTKDFINIVDKKDRAKFLLEVPAQLLAKGRVEYVYHAYDGNNNIRHVKLLASILPQGKRTYFVVMNFILLGN